MKNKHYLCSSTNDENLDGFIIYNQFYSNIQKDNKNSFWTPKPPIEICKASYTILFTFVNWLEKLA